MILPAAYRMTAYGTHSWAEWMTLPPSTPNAYRLSLHPIGGRIYIGMGDWTLNLGPTDVVSIDLDGNLVTHMTAVPTDGLDCYREIDGHIYAPLTDPTGDPPGAYGGYVSNKSGEWAWYQTNVPMVHCFDIVKTSHGLFMTGSARSVNGQTTEPVVVKSVDGGTVWTEVHHSERWALGRYYGIVAEGDSLFVRHSNAQQPVEASSDGGVTWSSVSRPDLHDALSSWGYDSPPETITDWPVARPSGATKPVRMGDKAYCCAQTGTSVTIYRRPAPPAL